MTADSYPFMDAAHSLVPFDLAKYGYVEQEFIVSGTANVYDWAADGSLTVKTEKAPYGARILVRRPANASKFSGAVVVEPMGAVRRFDWAIMYGYLNEHMMERGDAWVGITMPAASDGLKKFNPTRYAAVTFANPNPGEACPGAKGGPSPMEEGLRWDMMSQVGALLKSNAAGSPFAGFRVEGIYMTSAVPRRRDLSRRHPFARAAGQRQACVRRLSASQSGRSRQPQPVRRGARAKRPAQYRRESGRSGDRSRRRKAKWPTRLRSGVPIATSPTTASAVTKSPALRTSTAGRTIAASPPSRIRLRPAAARRELRNSR